MTFLDRYNSETTWHGRVFVMEIYHLAMCSRIKNWSLIKTAEYFQCSIGLVSENLRLATAIHINDKILAYQTRHEALKQMNGVIMGQVWKPQPFDVLRGWIDAIIDEASEKLSNWEEQFLDDVSHRVDNNQPLTETQERKLEEIYTNKTS